ncbi:hypothetical protein HDU91_000482, partial [Kappamyces sp. JEL0680]
TLRLRLPEWATDSFIATQRANLKTALEKTVADSSTLQAWSAVSGGTKGIVMMGLDKWAGISEAYLKHLFWNLHSSLEVEVWYEGPELSAANIARLQKVHPNIKCREFDPALESQILLYPRPTEKVTEKPYYLKQIAILSSSFQQVLFLDSDNLALRKPDFLFESEEFTSSGLVVWPDYFLARCNSPIYKIIGRSCKLEYEKESGQLLVDKKRHWSTLQLSLYFTMEKDLQFERRVLYGDKETFYIAANLLEKHSRVVPVQVLPAGDRQQDGSVCGYAMMQSWFDGVPLFMHANFMKDKKCATVDHFARPWLHGAGISWEDYCVQFKAGATTKKLSDEWPVIFDEAYLRTIATCFD